MHALASVILAATALTAAAPDSTALHRMLVTFLDGAARGEAAAHDRFWAEDLIYTGSSGRRVGKTQILADVRAAAAAPDSLPGPRYHAEDVRIQQYGDAALVAFRLVALTAGRESTSVARYLNSGMFVHRDGRWQVVGWQATREP